MEATSPFQQCVAGASEDSIWAGVVAGTLVTAAISASIAMGWGDVVWGSFMIGGLTYEIARHVLYSVYNNYSDADKTAGVFGFDATVGAAGYLIGIDRLRQLVSMIGGAITSNGMIYSGGATIGLTVQSFVYDILYDHCEGRQQ